MMIKISKLKTSTASAVAVAVEMRWRDRNRATIPLKTSNCNSDPIRYYRTLKETIKHQSLERMKAILSLDNKQVN